MGTPRMNRVLKDCRVICGTPKSLNYPRATEDFGIIRAATSNHTLDLKNSLFLPNAEGEFMNVDAMFNLKLTAELYLTQTSTIFRHPHYKATCWAIREGKLTPEMVDRAWEAVYTAIKAATHIGTKAIEKGHDERPALDHIVTTQTIAHPQAEDAYQILSTYRNEQHNLA
jgi:hypothetical protein